MSYNYLFACWGDGPGNLAPVLTAARRLRRRGHEVRVIADPDLREEVGAAGFPFASWRRAPRFSDVGVDPSDLRALLDRLLFAHATAYADDTRDELDRAPTDALCAHSMLLGSAVAAEAAGIPYALRPAFAAHQSATAAGRTAGRQWPAARHARPKSAPKSRLQATALPLP